MGAPRAIRYALVAVWALAAIGRGSAAVHYTPVELPSPSHAAAFGINSHGHVVGRAAMPSGETHAALWLDARELVDLGTLPGGTYSEAYAINDAGQVVGWSMTDQSTCTAFDGCWHAFLWENGTMTDLGGLDTRFQIYAYSINNRGLIAGASATADYPFGFWRAVTWLRGELQALAHPEGATDSLAYGINARGAAVGAAHINGRTVPVLWSQGTVSLLPTPGATSAEALKLNDRGQIVGRGGNGALLWSDGELAMLPNPAGTIRSSAYDINNAGLIVGESQINNGGWVASRWDGATVSVLPRAPGWTESSARAVNARGDIAGMGYTPTGVRAAVWLK